MTLAVPVRENRGILRCLVVLTGFYRSFFYAQTQGALTSLLLRSNGTSFQKNSISVSANHLSFILVSVP